ncbi:hypothetical protein CK203_015265 [Vitis vinifera]|uniref:DUF4283 domain-containing protein n=1 Tax=Vitis vinifera TaxID=29760 RepID=A0A438JK91_VITVI|nr:hypothetical protein CK203_015265 [Vitis vinifera]
MQRDFLLSGTGEGKKDHLIRWDVGNGFGGSLEKGMVFGIRLLQVYMRHILIDGTPTWWLDGHTDVLGRLLLKFSRFKSVVFVIVRLVFSEIFFLGLVKSLKSYLVPSGQVFVEFKSPFKVKALAWLVAHGSASPLFSRRFPRLRKKNLGEGASSPRNEADLNNFSSNEDMEGFLAKWGLILVSQQSWLCPFTPQTRGQTSVDIPNLEMEVIQPTCPYQMFESVNPLSSNLRSPIKESSMAAVNLGGIAGSPLGIFQEEEQMLHRIVRPVGFGSEIRVSEFFHEDNQLEY